MNRRRLSRRHNDSIATRNPIVVPTLKRSHQDYTAEAALSGSLHDPYPHAVRRVSRTVGT